LTFDTPVREDFATLCAAAWTPEAGAGAGELTLPVFRAGDERVLAAWVALAARALVAREASFFERAAERAAACARHIVPAVVAEKGLSLVGRACVGPFDAANVAARGDGRVARDALGDELATLRPLARRADDVAAPFARDRRLAVGAARLDVL